MDCEDAGCDCHGPAIARPPMEPAKIARLAERHQALRLVALADESESVAGGAMGYGGEGSWTNFASGLGLEGAVDDADLDRLVTFYASRGTAPRVEVCPFADPTLLNGLVERGFVAQEYEQVLARGLEPDEDQAAALSHASASGLQIELVDREDPAQVETFVEVSSHAFRRSGEPIPESMARVARRSVADPTVDSLLVRLDGSAVGAASASCHSGIACLWGACVLPASRRLGLRQALILRRLELARERRCTLAVIHARPDSPTERNAKLLGFALVYTKVQLEVPR